MKFTILGSTGFIGSHVATLATSQGHEVVCPARDGNLSGQSLGHIIYCIGLTADFRTRPHETIHAHISKLQEVLTETTFDSLVYLSSTRVYARCSLLSSATEDTSIPTVSQDFSDLYNLSKLMGESIGLCDERNVKVARLSNVVGSETESTNFLPSIIREAVNSKHVHLQTSLESSKDYIHVNDVAEILLRLGPEGRSQIYNIASGQPLTHRELVTEVSRLTDSTFDVAADAPLIRFPQIDIQRAEVEFDFSPHSILEYLPDMIWPVRSESDQAA